MTMRRTREERKHEIHEAAKLCFIEKGYPGTTMEDIIAKTELSKGGFYHYYDNKKQILIDIIKSGNIMYMQYNDHMIQIGPENSDEENIRLVTEAALDKFIMITPDKRIYAMFLCEMLYDKEIWEVFLKLEGDFFKWLTKRLNVIMADYMNELKFISRMMNGMMVTQNTYYEPELFERNREYLRGIYEPLIRKIVKKQ